MGSNLITLDGDPSNFICDMFQPKVTNFNDINFRKISKKKGEK